MLNREGDNGRILGRVSPHEFVGRAAELEQIISFATMSAKGRGLLLLLAPSAGVSELLRQAYDRLFLQRQEIVPIYFAFTRSEKTTAGAAQQFLQSFLHQLISYRNNDPTIIDLSLSNSDLLELAPPSDYEWIERMLESIEREQAKGDERAWVRLCLSAPQRAVMNGIRIFPMIDGVQLAERVNGEVPLGLEVAQSLLRLNAPFTLAGLRRQILDLIHGANGNGHLHQIEPVRLERLSDKDAGLLVEELARRSNVEVNDQTRDLIVQQFSGSPFFITTLVNAAREKGLPLTSYLNCQRLYVDELLGGRLNRHFEAMLEEIAPTTAVRRSLIKVLYETAANENNRSAVEVWRKRLGLEGEQLQRLLRALHVFELIRLNAGFVEMSHNYPVWEDYLRSQYRLEIAGETRALVVAETLSETLKRAPQRMARHYRKESALGLRDLLSRFNCQRVPSSLFHYDRFSRSYKGLEADAVVAGLDAETELIRLPQIVHAASCKAFYPPIQFVCDEERCAVAHGFDAATYTDANEVVWIVAEVESKLEAGRGMTEVWYDRLTNLARACGFARVRLWLISPEGFNAEAIEFLAERDIYGSSRQQLELLTTRIKAEGAVVALKEEPSLNEFELVIPMGNDTELIAATTVDQIARRIDFQPEEINQIKTALIEACINASEHSLSPDRKIYQRFRVENDRLIVTVSSRGVMPENFNGQNGSQNNGGNSQEKKGRRGWGLKLIRSLMDEVEFERVDDGTRLRMTKLVRKS